MRESEEGNSSPLPSSESANRQSDGMEVCLVREQVSPGNDVLLLPIVSADGNRAAGLRHVRGRLSRFTVVAASLSLAILATLYLSGRQQSASLIATRAVWRENHDTWSVLENEGDTNAMPEHVPKMTRVGRRFQDNYKIGMILAAAAHMASDTILEIKRSLLGMQHDEHVAASNSKIHVAETMLNHLIKVLGIQTIPEPTTTSKLASVKTAMRMANDLRMVIAELPEKTDALNLHEAQYNLAVYDLIQVSRQINEILMQISSDRTLDGIREPSKDRFDMVLRKAQQGLNDAENAYGADDNDNGNWGTATAEAVYNFLPAWKQRLEDYEGDGDTAEKSENSVSLPENTHNEEGKGASNPSESKAADEENSVQDSDSNGDQLIKFAVAAAIKQAVRTIEDRKHEATSQVKQIEEIAIESVMSQLQASQTLQLAVQRRALSAKPLVNIETSSGAATASISAGSAGPAVLSKQALRSYVLHLVKFAVYQSVRTGIMLEMRHPRWRQSIEDATSTAVDAAIKSQALKGLARLRLAEKAAVEGATKATKELEFKAMKGGGNQKQERAIAQRIEDSAVSTAIQSASEASERYKPLVFASSVHAVRPPSVALQAPPRFSISSSMPAGQSMIRMASSPSAYAFYPVRYQGPAGQVEVEEPAGGEAAGPAPESFQVD